MPDVFSQPVATGQDQFADLLARAQAGDGESFCALCTDIQDRLLRQAFALSRNEYQAQDLVQETLLAAWKSIRAFNGRCQFSTWLSSILLHRHYSALRRMKWRGLLSAFHPDDPQLGNVRDTAPTPDHAIEITERSRLILATLHRLPPRQRDVIFLRFYADESLDGIAAALNCSVGTIKSRLFHALKKLKEMQIFREDIL